MDVGDPGARTDPEDGAEPGFLEPLPQFELASRGVEQPAEIEVVTTRPKRPLHYGEVDVVLGGVHHHRGAGKECIEGVRVEHVHLGALEAMFSGCRLGPLHVDVTHHHLVGAIPCGQVTGDDPPDDPGTEQRDPTHETVSASASSKA